VIATVDNLLEYAEQKAKDMQLMPPTTEPVSRNFLDATFVWMLADQKQRLALWTHTRPMDLLSAELEHSASRSRDLTSADRPLTR
jgi:hypothetical protein